MKHELHRYIRLMYGDEQVRYSTTKCTDDNGKEIVNKNYRNGEVVATTCDQEFAALVEANPDLAERVFKVGDYWLEWKTDEVPPPKREEIEATFAKADPVIDALIEKQARLAEFYQKWPSDKAADIFFSEDDAKIAELRADWESL